MPKDLFQQPKDLLAGQPAAPPKPKDEGGGIDFGSAFKTVDDLVRSIASGNVFSHADELAALAQATLERNVGVLADRPEGQSAPDAYVSNLYTGPSDEQYTAALEKERARDRDIPLGVRIPGEIGGMAMTGLMTGGALTLPGAITRGAVEGGLYGFGAGEGGAAERAKSAAVGAGFGAAGGAAGHGISRLIQPKPGPDVSALMKEGVRPTTGQVLGGGMKTAEEKATSLPIMGPGVAKAQRRAIESFDAAAVNKALKPLGVTVPKNIKAGRDLIRWTADQASKAYNVLDDMTASADDAFRADMAKLSDLAKAELTPNLKKVFTKKLESLFNLARSQKQVMSGREAKEIVSELGREAARFNKSEKPFEQNLGQLYGAAKNAFTDALKRSNPGEAANRLDAADKAYANWVRIQLAASRTGSKEGIFTPAALNSAARQADKSVRKGQFAKGQALMQDFATQGENVIGNAYPDSGTAGRSLLAYLLGSGAIGAAVDPATTLKVAAPLAATLGAGRAAYTPTAQQVLAALLAGSRPQFAEPLAKAVSAAGPGAAVLMPR